MWSLCSRNVQYGWGDQINIKIIIKKKGCFSPTTNSLCLDIAVCLSVSEHKEDEVCVGL